MGYGNRWFCDRLLLIGTYLGVTNSLSMSMTMTPPRHFVGFDLGTSGARMSIVKESTTDDGSSGGGGCEEVFSSSIRWETKYDDPDAWWEAIHTLLDRAANDSENSNKLLLEKVQSICVSGTSASCLLIDGRTGIVTRKPRMYNYDVTQEESGMIAMTKLDPYAPSKHTTRANTSSLAKLLSWHCDTKPITKYERLVHQSDYISMKLMLNDDDNNIPKKKCGSGVEPPLLVETKSDWHNCLKLGYDVRNQCWPKWLLTCLKEELDMDNNNVLPSQVVSPGQPMGNISEKLSKKYGLPKDCVIVGGTTDSNAAFFAAAGSQPPYGTAVTSLGSTLAIKQLSQTFVEDAERGVYSHRFPLFTNNNDNNDSNNSNEAWLIGGASNVGCAVLRQEEFSDQELIDLSKEIDYKERSLLEYYPLAVEKGERFPVADSFQRPVLEPKPNSRKEYLHGILQGIANVEQLGYQTLGNLGATPSLPTIILTCGGGSKNKMWTQMRQHQFQQQFQQTTPELQVQTAKNTEASYGAAILAAATFLPQ